MSEVLSERKKDESAGDHLLLGTDLERRLVSFKLGESLPTAATAENCSLRGALLVVHDRRTADESAEIVAAEVSACFY